MATRSAIGYFSPRGYVTAVYCHYNGSPEDQLPILKAKYKSKPKVQALIRPGSMSILETEARWDSKYDTATFTYTPSRDPQPLYHHERGDGPWNSNGAIPYAEPPATCTDLTEAKARWRDSGCEWLYVLRPGYGWEHYAL
jgi:hypothetical protein